MRSIEQSLDSIATALTALAAVHAGGATTDAPAPTANTDAQKPRGRPLGSTNKPKPVEAAPTTAPEADAETTAADAVPDVTAAQTAVTRTIKAGFREDVLKVLAKYGAKNASGVKAEDRAAFIGELTELTAVAG